jgi:hypothetical protein
MHSNQILLYIFAVIALAGISFLGWAFYRLCLETQRSRRRHEKSNIASYAQPGFDFGGPPRDQGRRHHA